MIRKILLYIVILIAISGVVWLYLEMHKAGKEVDSPLKVISKEAPLVYEINSPFETRSSISNNSLVWQDLKEIDIVAQLDVLLHSTDTSIQNHPEWSRLLNNNPVYFILEPHGDSLGFIWAATHGAQLSESSLLNEAEDIFNVQKDDQGRYTFTLGGKRYYINFDNNLILIAHNPELIRNALERSADTNNLYHDRDFMNLYATSGKMEKGHLFLNTQKITELLANRYFKKQHSPLLNMLQNAGKRSVLDFSAKSNTWMFNGFTQSSKDDFLSLFSDRRPHDHQAIEVLSENTAGFVHLGFSNFQGWYHNYREFLDNHRLLYRYDSTQTRFADSFNLDLHKGLISWIESEVVSAYRNDPLISRKERYYAVFKTANEKMARERLLEISVEDSTETYSKFLINRLKYKGMMKFMPAELFRNLERPFYTIIDRYIIFAPSKRALQRIINDYIVGRTLANNENYKKFDQTVSAESNIYLFFRPALNNGFTRNFLTRKAGDFIAGHDSLMQKFGAVGVQWSFERDNLFYQTCNIMHNPIDKEQPHSIWELALDHPAATKPFVVKNHTTGAKEIFIQDTSGICYLISNTGRVLWKKQLPELIMGDVHQIDRYENNKLQLLFNTKSKLHLIDRLGNTVENYPVKLPAKALAAHSLFDYDNDGELRILIPAEGAQLLNYDKTGTEVKGWKFAGSESNIIAPVKHTRIKRKDYILTVSQNGVVQGFSRRGTERLHFNEKLPVHSRSQYFLSASSTPEDSYIVTADSLGTISKLYFNDKLQRKEFTRFKGYGLFQFADINQDGVNDYVFADSTEIAAFENDQNKIFSYSYSRSEPASLQIFNNNGTVNVGASYRRDNQVLLLSRTGQLWPKLPLRGSTPYALSDLNEDGRLNLITAGTTGILYNYIPGTAP